MGMGSSSPADAPSRASEAAAQRTAAARNYPGQSGAYPAQQNNASYPGASGATQLPPQVQATYTIRNQMNLNKGTLCLVQKGDRHCVSFGFDTESAGQCTIFYNASEAASGAEDKRITGTVIGQPSSFPKALTQTFEQEEADGLDLGKLPMGELSHSAGSQTYPIVILMEKDMQGEASYASQTTFAELDHDGQGVWSLKPLKQKIQLGENSYELQEIYGIELHEKAGRTTDDSGEGVECVICMTAPRDTTVLPCRHMCLCADCAKILRFQSNKCPVCREQVASLLQIKVKTEGNES